MLLLSLPAASGDDCRLTPTGVECRIGGTTTSIAGGGDPGPALPLRYLRVRDGSCWYWSAHPPGIDSRNLAHDARIIRTIARLPECVWEVVTTSTTVPTSEVLVRAWEVFRAFPLTAPTVRLEPAGNGITGLPTFASARMPPGIRHSEALPDGTTLEVVATITEVVVLWGDGSPARTVAPGEFGPRPHGAAHHVYTLKTCTETYRRTHPSGPNCHPDLEEYTIRVEFVWEARYRRGDPWSDLGHIVITRHLPYDVDEAVGILH